jgi:hypothetical protein
LEKFIPLVTRWQLHNLQNATRIPNQAALPFVPIADIKKRVLKGVPSFEVRWKDNHGVLCNVEHTEDLLVTTEPQEMFRTAYPDLVEKYVKEKEMKSRKGEQCYSSFAVFTMKYLLYNNNRNTVWHTIPFILMCVLSYYMFRLSRAIIQYMYIKHTGLLVM